MSGSELATETFLVFEVFVWEENSGKLLSMLPGIDTSSVFYAAQQRDREKVLILAPVAT